MCLHQWTFKPTNVDKITCSDCILRWTWDALHLGPSNPEKCRHLLKGEILCLEILQTAFIQTRTVRMSLCPRVDRMLLRLVKTPNQFPASMILLRQTLKSLPRLLLPPLLLQLPQRTLCSLNSRRPLPPPRKTASSATVRTRTRQVLTSAARLKSLLTTVFATPTPLVKLLC